MAGSKHNWNDIPSLNLEMDDEYDKRQGDKERRHHPRVGIDGLRNVLATNVNHIPIRIATARQGVFDGAVIDLSQSGVRVSSPKQLSTGELVRVGFNINDMTIITKVVTRWAWPNDMSCNAGLEFQELTSSATEFLSALATANMFSKTGAFRI